MGMFDDLDPDFMSSPGAALPLVAARVQAVRRRHQVIAASVVGTGLIVLLGSMALGSNGKPDRLTVSKKVTTTTKHPSTSRAPLITAPTTAASTSTTVAATSTTATLPAIVTSTSEQTTTTVPSPAHLTVAFDRARLVIQSGDTQTIRLTFTNSGGTAGGLDFPADCQPYFAWPTHQSPTHPIAWPVPASNAAVCAVRGRVEVPAHASKTARLTVIAGQRDRLENVVPAPPGDGSVLVDLQGHEQARLPVTITAPDTPPLAIDHPSEVTTASGAQNWVDFTITNNLPFPVRYIDQGPCSKDVDTPCVTTTPGHGAPGDLRVPPYKSAVKPLYFTTFTLAAHETRTAHAAVHGTTTLEDPNMGGTAIPPGIYHFDWDGLKVKFTVTP
jgi:hypothetical protein